MARRFSPLGEKCLQERRALTPDVGRARVVLVESFAGIGGARGELELLSIRPIASIAIEWDEEAQKVLKHHYTRMRSLVTSALSTPRRSRSLPRFCPK